MVLFLLIIFSVRSLTSVQGKKKGEERCFQAKQSRQSRESPAVGGATQKPFLWVLSQGGQPCLQGEGGLLHPGSAPRSALWLCVREAEGADK